MPLWPYLTGAPAVARLEALAAQLVADALDDHVPAHTPSHHARYKRGAFARVRAQGVGDAYCPHTANRNAKVARGDRKWPLNEEQIPPETARCSAHVCEYGLQFCRGESAGVAKRPRERPPTRHP